MVLYWYIIKVINKGGELLPFQQQSLISCVRFQSFSGYQRGVMLYRAKRLSEFLTQMIW